MHVVVYVSSPLFFIAPQNVIWICAILFNCSLVDGHLGCFYILTLTNNAAINNLCTQRENEEVSVLRTMGIISAIIC